MASLSQPVDVFVKQFAPSCSTWWRIQLAKSDRLPDDGSASQAPLWPRSEKRAPGVTARVGEADDRAGSALPGRCSWEAHLLAAAGDGVAHMATVGKGWTSAWIKAELWRAVSKALEGRPTDDVMCLLGVEVIEPLIDLYWAEVVDEFEDAVRKDARLRKALSCCDFDSAVPPEVRQRLYSYIRPQDDIGHQPVSGADPQRHDR